MYEIGRGWPSRTLAVPSLSNWEAMSLLSQDKIGSSPAQMLHWGKGRKKKILERDLRGGGKRLDERQFPRKRQDLPEGILC